MTSRIFVALLLVPSFAFAQKPTCETIRKAVENAKEKPLQKLNEEKAKLESLRDDIRRGKGRLEGKDGLKPRREQLQILAQRIKEAEKKITEYEASNLVPMLNFAELKPGAFGSFGKGDVRDFVINEIIDNQTFTAFLRYQRMEIEGNFFRYIPTTGTTLYLVKGIDTTGKADGKFANWEGYLYCSGTQKMRLVSGNETVYVLEPLDVEACFKKEPANQSPPPSE